jgi:hypothetical protein
VEHPDTLTSMGNLALTYWNQGRWKEAKELGVEVMESSIFYSYRMRLSIRFAKQCVFGNVATLGS